MFRQIHEIVFNGQGGYDWDTIYNMPIWLRRFTFETMREHYESKNKEKEDLNNATNSAVSNQPLRPNIAPQNPTYVTSKAPKK